MTETEAKKTRRSKAVLRSGKRVASDFVRHETNSDKAHPVYLGGLKLCSRATRDEALRFSQLVIEEVARVIKKDRQARPRVALVEELQDEVKRLQKKIDFMETMKNG